MLQNSKVIKKYLIRIYYFLVELGFDIRKMYRAPKGLLRYCYSYYSFRKQYKNNLLYFRPYINDWYDSAGRNNDEYFIQDLYVARQIFKSKPVKHFDIGSKIDGFVSNVASFMEITILDIRPLENKNDGINYLQCDLMNETMVDQFLANYGYTGSLSCLHSLEHFGLGRYGDTIDVDGYVNGFRNMAKLLGDNGKFYFSTPIGKERVEFNANRVFDPNTILNLAKKCGLTLDSLKYINCAGDIIEVNLDVQGHILQELSISEYSLGLFVFTKRFEI
jgi:hypothetical protein